MNIEWSEDMSVVKRWNASASAWAEFSSDSSCESTYCKHSPKTIRGYIV